MVGLFRRPVVRSGDAIHRPGALPRLTEAIWVLKRNRLSLSNILAEVSANPTTFATEAVERRNAILQCIFDQMPTKSLLSERGGKIKQFNNKVQVLVQNSKRVV
jgi:hypothetical protein